MKRAAMKVVLLLIVMPALLSAPSPARGQSLPDYTAVPPFVRDVVAPNVLLLFDNSGSMGTRAAGDRQSGDFNQSPKWDETQTYSGLFDSLLCYTYDATNTRFEPAAKKSPETVATKCADTTHWDGNFLNYVTPRRIDLAKIAMIGGTCAVARNSDGTCPPSGSPAKITMKGIDFNLPAKLTQTGMPDWSSNQSTPGVVAGGGANGADGRVPKALQPGAGNSIYFHLPGTSNNHGGPFPLSGSFCIDNDDDPPQDRKGSYAASACNRTSTNGTDSDSFVEMQFVIRVAVDAEPRGVIQELGDKVRFGLIEFQGKPGDKHGSGESSGRDDGGKVLVPIGSRQAINFKDDTVETFTTNAQAMIDAIEETYPYTGTPLAEALYESARYVAQVNSYYFPGEYAIPLAYSPAAGFGSSGTGSLGSDEITALTGSETCPSGYISNACGRDPYFFGTNHTPVWTSPSDQVPCCKTFVIVFTDGASHSDSSIPSAISDYGDAHHGSHCTGSGCSGHRTDYGSDGSHYLDDVAYWAHTTDLRQATIPVINESGHDLPGFQNITVYTFFAFGTVDGRELLQTTAKLGGFEDLNGNNDPDLVEEWDRINNYTGAEGADGIPDTYFESSNADEMKGRLMAALSEILQRSGSGSSASVLASSSAGEGALYQSFFFPSTLEGLKEIKWTGYTQGLFIDAFGNLREDSNGDGKLIYDDDRILRTRYDTVTNEVIVDLYDDADGNGMADSATPSSSVGLREVKGIWEAGKRLALTAPGSRSLTTWVDLDHDKVVDSGEQIDLTTANSATLAPYLRPGAAPYTTDNIINFVRGDQITGLRNRELTVGGSPEVWKLGDAIHSRPVVVGAPGQRFDIIYGDSSYTDYFQKYKDRRQVIYLGANDGMLHGFNAGYFHRGDDPSTTTETEHGWFTRTPTDNSGGPLLGDELFGFIPQELLPHLKWLTQPDYPHVYYVDLSPKVTDARIFTPDTDHPNGWGTILMGGLRFGGSCGACPVGSGAPMTVTADFNGDGDTTDPDDTRNFYSAYFVLDITNPESADYPKLLWSFSSADLGFTAATPSMLRVSPASSGVTDNTDAKWYMVVGSGPTGYDGSIAQAGNLYAIDLAQGPGANNANVKKLAAETLTSFMGSTVSIDRDFDYRVDVAYLGSAIDDGSAPWRGKLYRLTMNACTVTPCSPDIWGISDGAGKRQPTEILDTFPSSGSLELGPVGAAPAVAIDDSNKLWVFAGTGRYYGMKDKTNVEQQYFVGVKDSVLNAVCTESTRVNCHDEDLVDVSSAQICVVGVGTCGASTDQVTGVSGASDFPSLIALVASKDGWYTTLPASGERALSRPLAIGGLVLFPTFVPANDPCASTGESNLYALYYMTGSAYSSPVIGTTASGSNKNVNRTASLGSGLASEAVVHIGDGGEGGKATAYVQKSSSEVTSIEFASAAPITSRFVTWYNARD